MKIIFDHAMFVLPLTAMLAAQFVKFISYCVRHKTINWHYLLTPGHMPSAHSAFVSSLVFSVGYYDGTSTGAFAVSIAFATIVVYDAVRIRIHIGDQGKVLNMLVSKLQFDNTQFPHLKERVGHYTREVVVGILFGITLTAALIALFEAQI